MIVMHKAAFADGPRRGSSRRTVMAVVVLLFATMTIALVVVGLHYAEEQAPSPRTGANKNGRILASANFAALSSDNSQIADLIRQTAVDKAALKPMTPEEAQAANERIPLASGATQSARPLLVPIGDGTNYLRSLDCLASAIYYEAATEPVAGKRAVAQVVLNRVRHAAYPHTVCGVVYQGAERDTGCQFSFTCDGSLLRRPSQDGWRRARSIASAALGGVVYAPVGLATHYHADYVLPYWAPTLNKLTVIGRHIFYSWPGAWGQLRAFDSRYDVNEPDVATLLHVDVAEATSAREGSTAQVASSEAERPVLLSGRVITTDGKVALNSSTGTAIAAKPSDSDASGRVYLLSRRAPQAAPTPAAAPPAYSAGVTGGVITMPGVRRPASAEGGQN